MFTDDELKEWGENWVDKLNEDLNGRLDGYIDEFSENERNEREEKHRKRQQDNIREKTLMDELNSMRLNRTHICLILDIHGEIYGKNVNPFTKHVVPPEIAAHTHCMGLIGRRIYPSISLKDLVLFPTLIRSCYVCRKEFK